MRAADDRSKRIEESTRRWTQTQWYGFLLTWGTVFALRCLEYPILNPVDARRAPPERKQVLQVDVNRCDQHELMLLPRIGPKLANEIISYRDGKGPFTCREDLLSVPGIGEMTASQIDPFLVYESGSSQ